MGNTYTPTDDDMVTPTPTDDASDAPENTGGTDGGTQGSETGGNHAPSLDLSGYTYDPSENAAYQQALSALQNAQANAPTYAGRYDGQLDAIYQKIMNREPFKYDINDDMLYQQYADQYTRLGNMAMQDTMGQAAAMTGGYGNSYASTAGNQAYQNYLQQLNDVVPELYGMAREQYNEEGKQLLNQYSVTGEMADREYSHYQDALKNYMTNLSYLQGVADDAYDRGYENWYNSLDLATAADNEAYDREQDLLDNADPDETHTTMSTEDLSYWYERFYNISKYGTVADAVALMDDMEKAGYSADVVDSVFGEADLQARTDMDANTGEEVSDLPTEDEVSEYYTDYLWVDTGLNTEYKTDNKGKYVLDKNGNKIGVGNRIFRGSDNKTTEVAEGVNPYTGTKNPDIKYGTCSNGYQPNNIGGTPLEETDITTDITGKMQKVWKANGKYWLWVGKYNSYVEVDVSELGAQN